MKILTSTVLVSVLTVGIAATAGASQNTPISVEPFTDTDTQLIFKQNDHPKELATLSPKEMKETEGAWGFGGAIIGGVGGGAGYLISNVISNTPFNVVHLGTAITGAAINGAVSGPVGVIWGFNASLALGMVNGIGGRP